MKDLPQQVGVIEHVHKNRVAGRLGQRCHAPPGNSHDWSVKSSDESP